MLWRVWAAIGAITVGVGVATLLGGGAPFLVEIALLAVGVAGIFLSIVSSITRRRRRLEWPSAPAERARLPAVPPLSSSAGNRQRPASPRTRQDATEVRRTGAPVRASVPQTTDELAAGRLVQLVGERELSFLRRENFGSPWLERDVTRLRELAQIKPNVGEMTDPTVASAVSRLTAAAVAFIDLYDATTAADPITVDGRWRIVISSESIVELKEAATELAESHDLLLESMAAADEESP